ncbi:hypothetical protein C8J55DRAFT_505045 [Lentinula edodes]|uniref:Uncharacterized protein n=1 Tax=Lentinula lateritia TaxID=40482 RepID=A0A9W9AV55_9AGAR|nr:hypothetical protein C8J55DRAFT_505045 [Lentinula edodes]
MPLAAISTPTSTGKVDSLPTAPSPSTLNVLPRITPVPTSDDYPTEVVVALTTTILIPDYPLYYHMPISQFSPSYQALPDGSLIAAPYRHELQQDNGVLLLMGILLTIFLRNALVSGNYLRRIKVQRTIIFRMLFASQVIAFIGLVPKIASFLTPHVNCHIVQVVISVASTLSIVFIMSGIFGYKAYKCLDNSVFILATLAILTVGAVSMSLADYITLRGTTRLSGNCARSDDMRWIRIFVMLQLAQSIFLCCCFLSAVWKSRHNSVVARDRISVPLSMDFEGYVPSEKALHLDRWDFALGHKPDEVVGSHPQSAVVAPSEIPTRQSSVREELSALPPSRLRIRSAAQAEDESSLRPLSSGPAVSLAPSTFSRISHYMPFLFRKVMKDELCYTAMITVCCATVAIIAVVGVTSEGLLWFMGWACLYWTITSILATHSLGRAVDRHEKETVLQAAALHTRRWETERTRVTGVDRNFASSNRIRRFATRNTDSENPFDDTRALASTYSDSMLSSPSDTPSSPRSFSLRSGFPLCPSPTLQLPTSGRTTPLVPLDNTRAVPSGTGFIIEESRSTSGRGYRS